MRAGLTLVSDLAEAEAPFDYGVQETIRRVLVAVEQLLKLHQHIVGRIYAEDNEWAMLALAASPHLVMQAPEQLPPLGQIIGRVNLLQEALVLEVQEDHSLRTTLPASKRPRHEETRLIHYGGS